MKFSVLSLILLIGIIGTGFAQDTVVLKNGDVLSGRILEQTPEHVYFKSTAFGSISLRPQDIQEIRIIEEGLGEITVPEEAVSKKEDGKGNLPPIENKKPEIAKKRRAKKKNAWSGQAGLAIAMREKTSSNAIGVYKEEQFETYRLYGNVNWKGERNSLKWAWTYRYSEDEYRVRDDFFNVNQKYHYSFKDENLYSTAKTVYQKDYNRRIENEFLQTAEMGIKWFSKDSKVQLSTSAGAGYHAYNRLDRSRTYDTKISKLEFIFDQAFRWELFDTLAIIQKYTHLGDTEQYNMLFSAGLENKLVRDLFIRFEYRLNQDTEVYYDDKGYYDKALLTSLLYKF